MSTIKFKNKYRIPSARWVDWDYGNEGAYFVTICTKNRLYYFGEIENAEMQYSTIGEIAAQEWLKSMQLRPDMELDMECFQVMPNHIHGIVLIGRDCRDTMHCVSTNDTNNKFGPQKKNLASIIRGFKSAVTIQARKLNIPFEWQSSYHDRVIRDDMEFRRIAAYIEQNPLNWKTDKLNGILEI
jgi:REP element-mobilizing transposase RayT